MLLLGRRGGLDHLLVASGMRCLLGWNSYRGNISSVVLVLFRRFKLPRSILNPYGDNTEEFVAIQIKLGRLEESARRHILLKEGCFDFRVVEELHSLWLGPVPLLNSRHAVLEIPQSAAIPDLLQESEAIPRLFSIASAALHVYCGVVKEAAQESFFYLSRCVLWEVPWKDGTP